MACRHLSARGKTPSTNFFHLNTVGFLGSRGPATSFVRFRRLFVHSLVSVAGLGLVVGRGSVSAAVQACLILAGIVGPCLSSLAAETTAPTARARNVVLIISDDQHWADYGFMGHPSLRTPHLDRLARESLVFRRGYVPSSLCCPSLASMITGRYPHEHLVVGNDPPGSEEGDRRSPQWQTAFQEGRSHMAAHLAAWPLLPAELAEHGIRSLQTGKWWQGHFSQGGFSEGMTKGARHGDDGLTIGRRTMQPVTAFIDRCQQEDRPFFVWYAPMLPHDPHDPAEELVEHYTAHTDSLHVARYWGNVERFDASVGELLDHLDARELSDDTLVVYVTDNGWIQRVDAPRFAPRSKISPYEGGLRTPIMLRQPGAIAPAENDRLASSLDIMPTVLAACGIEPPAGLPGVDLLDADAVASRKQLFGECFTHTLVDLDDPGRSLLWRWTVRDDRDATGGHLWKLIEPATARGRAIAPAWDSRLNDPTLEARYAEGVLELFDVANDPAETKNLSEAEPGVVAELQQSLDAWWSPAAMPGVKP
jgi:arylsulfatase A-like enzyme